MRHYDYLGMNSLDITISEQMRVLYGTRIINKHNQDLEPLILKVLEACTSEVQIENTLHDVKVGNETLEQMLVRKGYII